MSKPDKPGELRDVAVNAISLVPRAANGQKFKIFKSADFQDREILSKEERGFFNAMKNFFKSREIHKGAVQDEINESQTARKLDDAFMALLKVLKINRWGEPNDERETDAQKIMDALEDFKNIAVNILLGRKSDIEKSGRKISGPRLSKLKDIQSLINDVINSVDNDEDSTEETETEMTKDEVQKAVGEAVKNALKPIAERIEKIEKARGFSNKVPEDTQIEKDDGDIWGGIF